MKTTVALVSLSVFTTCALILLCGCTTPGAYVPPWYASASVGPAVVSVGQPGYTVPAKVVPTAGVTVPTVLVPVGHPLADNATVPVTTGEGNTVIVPVAIAPVLTPILAVPK
jgi:hypothetical protein